MKQTTISNRMKYVNTIMDQSFVLFCSKKEFLTSAGKKFIQKYNEHIYSIDKNWHGVRCLVKNSLSVRSFERTMYLFNKTILFNLYETLNFCYKIVHEDAPCIMKCVSLFVKRKRNETLRNNNSM